LGGEVARGLEQPFENLFGTLGAGSSAINKGLKELGIDATVGSPEFDKKASELLVEVGGIGILGKGHRSAKKFVEKQVPTIKMIRTSKGERFKDETGKFVAKPEEKPQIDANQSAIDGMTKRGKTPEEIATVLNIPKKEVAPRTESEAISELNRGIGFADNKKAVFDILDKDPSLSGSPRQISIKMNTLVEKGKLKNKVSVNTIKEIANEWKIDFAKKQKKQTVEPPKFALEDTEVSNIYGGKTGKSKVGEILKDNPEFRVLVENLTDPKQIQTVLQKAWNRKQSAAMSGKEPNYESLKDVKPTEAPKSGEVST
jgi:hypothetical protein